MRASRTLSPTSRLFITQVGLEPLLRDRPGSAAPSTRFGTELVRLRAGRRRRHGGSARATAVPTRRSAPDYLVAADGAHSPVREPLGIEMEGRGSFADCVTIYFRADMRDLIGDRNLSVVYVNQPELLGFFRFSITGDAGFLAVFSTINPDGTKNTAVGETMDTARATELVRKALGRADIPVEIDNVQRWSAAAAHASPSATGGCSWPATPRTSCRRPGASAATPASATPTTWPGSWPRWSQGPRAPGCWTPTTPSAGRCAG